MRVDITLDGLCASLLGTEERVTVRENDTVLDVEVDITVGDFNGVHVLTRVHVGDANGRVGVRVLADLV